MMRARVNLITADPDRMADTIGYIKTSVRPAVDSMDGSLGLSLYANAEIGVAVLESFWASREALIHSEQMAAPRRTDVVRRAVGTVSVERYRVPVYEREAPLDTAAGLRLTRMDVDTGHSISETMWDSHKALAASRGEAAAVRVETVQSTGALVRAVEEYDLVFSTARIGGV